MANGVWSEVQRAAPETKGFDDDGAWLPHCAIGSENPVVPGMPAELLSVRVGGSFSAIEAIAGWSARLVPSTPRLRADLLDAADEIADLASALREALADLETETV